MEDSAKRKARLQAMRMEASSASTERPSPSSTANTPLSNPLVSPNVPSQESSPSSHRFGYYTDPTAAYAAAKRKTNDRGEDPGLGRYSHPLNLSSPMPSPSSAGQQMEYHMPPTYTSHAHQAPSPNQNLYDSSFARSQTVPLRSPVQYPSPSTGERRAYAPQFPSPSQSSFQTPFLQPQTGALRSPIQYPSPASGDRRTHHNLPRPWNMSGNSSEQSFTPNSSNCGASSFRHGESRTNSGYSGIRGSPHSYSSGGGWQSRGRGGYHNQDAGSGRRPAKSFYQKSMVKDPWRKLKPVVGNILIPLSESLSWLPKSIAPKKAKVVEASVDFKPNQNLAEFLALAFEESISNEREGEGSVLPNPGSED